MKEGELMTKSCKTCKNRLDLEKWDYTDIRNHGVSKTKYDGFACLAFASEGLVVHLVGTNEDRDMCECYSEMI